MQEERERQVKLAKGMAGIMACAMQGLHHRCQPASAAMVETHAGVQEDRERQTKLAERMAGIKAWRQAAGDRQVAAKDARSVRNRAVLRMHERLARSANKARGDDRAQRLAALKVPYSGPHSQPKVAACAIGGTAHAQTPGLLRQ